MSPEIIQELYFLFHCFLMGVFITALYDVLRILRRIIPHNTAAVSAEDFLYWILCSLLIFAMLIRENNGVLRWFAVAGAMTGMLLYRKTFGFLFVKYTSLLIKKLCCLSGRILKAVLKPFERMKRNWKWRRKKSQSWLKLAVRRLKNKLTAGRKLLRMFLYKW